MDSQDGKAAAMRVCHNCDKEFPSTAVIKGKVRILSSRKYCLICSPFGSNNRVRLHDPIGAVSAGRITYCKLCGCLTEKGRTRCYTCTSRIRRFRVKSAAVKLLGGKCCRCGWSGHIAGFDFHHKDGGKDFQIGSSTNRSWSFVQRELKKCELLCAICHRIEHSGLRDRKFMMLVNEYEGELLDFTADGEEV